MSESARTSSHSLSSPNPAGFDLRRQTTGTSAAEFSFREMWLTQRVTAQAELDPQRIALVADDEVLTYAELRQRANQVAHCLRLLQVRPETVVAVCLDRSIEMIVSVLGIVMAGGAYLPLDPSYPGERLAFMLKDAGATLLLTRQQFGKSLPTGNWQSLDVDEIRRSHFALVSIDDQPTESNLAYVIYTSGSTGRPKGVQITHASLLNLVSWHQATFAVQPEDRATQLVSPSFDAAVWELWPYLTAGASIYLPSDIVRSEPSALRDWLVAKRITITFVPTPLAERMIHLAWPHDTALRFLLTGADTLHSYPPPGLPFTLVNNYGPTECTVVASSGTVPNNGSPDGLPSIGRPIANAEIFILDEKLNQVPTGVTGELYIGGAGVARGYVNHPELTANRFVPNPFSTGAKDRLYRTGDLGHYLADGQIAFKGRIDDQIKIRGYRIEPDEVIAALNCYPGIDDSFVVASDDPPDGKRLVAYIVSQSRSRFNCSDLRDFLGKRLPEYMIPSSFFQVASLPMTANGKIDRERLPTVDPNNALHDEVVRLPQTDLQTRVAAILANLLKLKRVDIHDNFFLLGGHSLLGIHVIGRIQEEFGVELPLFRLFEAPTVAALSSEIERLLFVKIQEMSEEEAERLIATDNTDRNRSL